MTESQRKEIADKMKAEHGRVVSLYKEGVDGDPDIFGIAKRVPRAEYKRFRAALFDDAQKSDAMEQLARACVVYPSREEFAQLLEDFPAVAEGIAGKLLDAARGGDKEFEAKKL